MLIRKSTQWDEAPHGALTEFCLCTDISHGVANNKIFNKQI